VEEQDAEQLLSFFEKKNLPSLLGSNKFVEWAKANFFEGGIHKDVPQSKILAPDRPTIINAVCGFYKADEKDIAPVRRGVQNEPRDVAIYLLRTICGEPLMRIGQAFGMTQYSSVSSAVERIKKKRQNDSRFQKRLKEVIESVNKGQT
jgi:REP-associated tyrosine transposase